MRLPSGAVCTPHELLRGNQGVTMEVVHVLVARLEPSLLLDWTRVDNEVAAVRRRVRRTRNWAAFDRLVPGPSLAPTPQLAGGAAGKAGTSKAAEEKEGSVAAARDAPAPTLAQCVARLCGLLNAVAWAQAPRLLRPAADLAGLADGVALALAVSYYYPFALPLSRLGEACDPQNGSSSPRALLASAGPMIGIARLASVGGGSAGAGSLLPLVQLVSP